jgi:hypothetical protein
MGNQEMVNNSKEGNAAIGLTPNSYDLMHHSSDKEFKTARRWQMHRGLPCVVGESVSSSSTVTSSSFSIYNHI